MSRAMSTTRLRISVLVKTQARNQALTKIADNEYTISVHAPPIKGKANDAVIQILAKHFAVPQSCVKIIRGQSARKKLIQIG
jgi:uncharacterized protein